MKALLTSLLLPGFTVAPRILEDQCAELAKLVQSTYDFKPSQLDDPARKAKFAEMDRVWELVKSSPAELAPCLRSLLEADGADPWFCCDGSALLVEVDPSAGAKELQARLWCRAPLADVDLEPWTWTLMSLGAQGLDVSAGGEAWLGAREASFTVAQHALTVGPQAAGLFVFGSMDEALATPVLARIAADGAHPGRADALAILSLQATEDALERLRALDLSACDEGDRKRIEELVKKPDLLRPRSGGPRRDKLLAALQAFVAGQPEALDDLRGLDEHWFEHVASALKDEDLPLLRQRRRKRLLALSDEDLLDYVGYSQVLWAKVWKPAGN